MDVAKIESTGNGILPLANIANSLPVFKRNGISSSTSTISDLSRSLYQTNIDLSKSIFSSEGNNTQFTIQFLRQSEQKMTLNGSISNDLTSGSVSFSCSYLQSEIIEGRKVNKEYQVNFNLSFSSNKSVSIEKTEKKEDILDFLRRITNDIFKKLSDNSVNISAVVLDSEDLKDLAQITDKKARQLINQLIEMIKYAVEAKMMANKDKDTPDEIYYAKRITQEVKETSITNQIETDYSFSIKEIGIIGSAE